MNCPFKDVMFNHGPRPAAAHGEKRTARGYEADEAAMTFDGARPAIVVPGYGMAVSQAQHAEIADEFEANGTEVRHAIHLVAGRMPGHRRAAGRGQRPRQAA